MAQIATTIRMDSELKNELNCLCEEFGMSINTAFNIFAKAVVRSRSIPFRIEVIKNDSCTDGRMAFEALREDAKSLPDISLDEINSEIKVSRASSK
ncbi:MAG: type II toxin-antitoxin system RelB/DinJ family antitoxin [Muribaculaceae bacterium]|nr:type II toxin-antitoxin system RelB/DinJ family antitoxin [Muribaculaceae bacterium]